MEDTVTDVELDEVFDTLDEGAETEEVVDIATLAARRRKTRGLFGLRLGGEVLLFGILSLIGLACAILAIIVGNYFWWYIVAAILIGPISWLKFWDRWRRWTAGRSWVDAVAEALGAGPEEGSAD